MTDITTPQDTHTDFVEGSPNSLVPQDAVPVPERPPVAAPPGGKVVTLPSGFHVAIKPARALRQRDRAKMFDGLDPEGASKMAFGMGVVSNILAAVITDWDVRDYDDATGAPVGDVLPLPSADPTSLGLLSMPDAAALDPIANEVRAQIMPDFDPSPDESSPTAPSAG